MSAIVLIIPSRVRNGPRDAVVLVGMSVGDEGLGDNCEGAELFAQLNVQ